MKRRLPALTVLLIVLLLLLCGCGTRYKGDYNKALKAFSNADYGGAAEIFDECDPSVGNAVVYAAYSHGMVLWEQEQYAASLPYFEKCQGFMYGTQRYHIAHALSLMEQDSFTEAKAELELVGDFEKAPQMAAYCAARVAEDAMDYDQALVSYSEAGEVLDAQDRLLNLQMSVYQQAIEWMNSGNTEDALILFNDLGDYLNSATYAQQCRNVSRETSYDRADALEEEGSLEEAYRIFQSIGAYRDAADRANQLAEKLGIPIVDGTKTY